VGIFPVVVALIVAGGFTVIGICDATVALWGKRNVALAVVGLVLNVALLAINVVMSGAGFYLLRVMRLI
jgi:hypothetical protein